MGADVLKIDPEFKNKIPPIGEEEFKQLRDNILADGEVHEAIVVWNGTIVDGHNRWKVIQENPGIKYRVREMDFADKWAAFEWMYRNQLGRRNLTDEQRAYTIGKMYEARKKSVGAQSGNDNALKQSAQSGEIVLNADKLRRGVSGKMAIELNLGHNTIRRAAKFAKGVDAIRKVNPDAADKVLAGDVKAIMGAVQKLANADEQQVREAADAVMNGKKPNPSKANPAEEEPKGNKKPVVNEGYPRDKRELMRIINEANAPLVDPNFKPTSDLDTLIEEIEINGKNYVRSLRNTISIRVNLLDSMGAKNRVYNAINAVMRDITKLRGEYT